MNFDHFGYCPVCHKPVSETKRANIGSHFDNAGRVCVASGEPYAIVLEAS